MHVAQAYSNVLPFKTGLNVLIDWRWGEAYFAGKLLDYDASANVGNWQWAAGCGCDAAPYFRIFNPDIDIRNQNVDARVLSDKWVQPGDEALYRAFSFVTGDNRVGSSSRFVQKNNYLTLSTITLGYTLYNRETLKKWKLENLRFNMTLNDIARISTIQIERGTDYPFARRISFGASVTF